MSNSKQRSHAFSIAVDATGEKTIVSMVHNVKNLKEAQQALNKAGYENVKVVEKQEDSERRLRREYRAAVTQINAQSRAYQNVTADLARQAQALSANSERQAALNAVARLGVNATNEQRAAVAAQARELQRQVSALDASQRAQREQARAQKESEQAAQRATNMLDREVASQRQLATASRLSSRGLAIFNALERAGVSASSARGRALAAETARVYDLTRANYAAQGSMRGVRGAAQNLGWQMQDVAVQMQMGTNAFVIFSQQGSQIASSFGPWGAAIGAGIAVVGAAIPPLLTYLGEVNKEMDELINKKLEILAEPAQQIKNIEYLNNKLSETTAELEMLEKGLKTSTVMGTTFLSKGSFSDEEIAEKGEKIKALNLTLRDTKQALFELEGGKIAATSWEFTPPTGEQKAEWQREIEEMNRESSRLKAEYDAEVKKANDIAIAADAAFFAEIDRLRKESVAATAKAEKERVAELERSINAQVALQEKFNAMMASQEVELTVRTLGLDGFDADRFREIQKLVSQGFDASQIETYMAAWDKLYEVKVKDEKVTQSLAEKYRIMTEQLEMSARAKTLDNLTREKGLVIGSAEYNRTVKQINAYYDEKDSLDARNATLKEAQRLSDERLSDLTSLGATIDKLNNKEVKTASPYSAFGDVNKIKQQGNKLSDALRDMDKIWDSATTAGDVDAMEMMLSPDWVAREQELLDSSIENNKAYAEAKAALQDQIVAGQLGQVEQLTGTLLGAAEEGSAAYKALFLLQQAFAISQGTIQAFEQASLAKTAAMLAAPGPGALAAGESAYALTLGLGMANVGATAGVAFAGAFDKGGMIPAGQAGVVSEFGDELVGGTLVYNQSGSALPVTGREKTAELMKKDGQGGMTVHQSFNINGNPDKSALMQMKMLAKQATLDAYGMVQSDFKNDKGVARRAARR